MMLRALSSALVLGMTVQLGGPIPSFAAPVSGTQMASPPETVYVSNYGSTGSRSMDFNDNWKFYLGDASGAEQLEFDTSSWRSVDLPHDYSIEQEYSKSMEAESGYLPGGIGWYRKTFTLDDSLRDKQIRIDFDGVYMDSTVYINGQELGTHAYGYTPFSFDISEYVRFGQENVIAVKVNHQIPSSRWYSGSGIYRDVKLTATDQVHVDLFGTHVTTPGLNDKTPDDYRMNIETTVCNDGSVSAQVVLTHTLYKKNDTETAQGSVSTEAVSVKPGASAEIKAVLTPSRIPVLWSTTDPALYVVRTQVKVNGTVVDTYDTDFGFRYLRFDQNTGFYLNGEALKLKGVCMHHDQGALGSENHYDAVERQVDILMDMGCNSIRVTHNPASQNLIDICNEKGILVIEEMFDGWYRAKNGNNNDFARFFRAEIPADNQLIHAENGMTWAEFSLQSAIRRDRSAPSVIMWSLGNEISEGAGGTDYHEEVGKLIDWAGEVDDISLRPLTVGSNKAQNLGSGTMNPELSDHAQVAEALVDAGGVSGINYANRNKYENIHRAYPHWPIYGSETASSVNSRGIYKNTDKQRVAYDTSAVNWGALANDAWRDVISLDFVAGEYVWTGFDYLGEPTPWNGIYAGPASAWPSPKNSFFGIIDTAGLPKDSYYLYRSFWNDDEPTIHILPAWNEEVISKDQRNETNVVVYAGGSFDGRKVDSIRLSFIPAGQTEAARTYTGEYEIVTTGAGYTYQVNKADRNKMYFDFMVPFAPGTLQAEALSKGQPVLDRDGKPVTATVTTSGVAERLTAAEDRQTVTANGDDLIYVEIDVEDAKGVLVPGADNEVTVTVKGPGKLVGMDNGNSPDHTSFQAPRRRAFNGKLVAIIQADKTPGEIAITASAPGLRSSTVAVEAKPAAESQGQAQPDSFLMSKTYYVKVGSQPVLPDTITVRYTDGSEKSKAVRWEKPSDEQISKINSFTLNGTVEEISQKVSVNINMIDEAAALLNYSAATPVGKAPVLPASRPAVMADGSILNASFPVTWDKTDDADFSEVGIKTVTGTADVLGKPLSVKASVRVQKETTVLGDSVSGAAALEQNIPADQQSDKLESINDGLKSANNNRSRWSNWAWANAGHTTSEIVFRYATQQRIGKAVIYFGKDNGTLTYPDAGKTELWISETGEPDSYRQVKLTETIGKEIPPASDNGQDGPMKAYTYAFDPFTATFIKLKITNSTTKERACTGIVEVELLKAESSYTTNSQANLEALSINGESVGAFDLKAGETNTLYKESEITALDITPAGNAAVTRLPAHKGVITLLLESEDHMNQGRFLIHLEREPIYYPEDAKYDYTADTTAAIAKSIYNGSSEGPTALALDGRPETHWHTNWATSEAKDVNYRWLALDLGAVKPIGGVRYLPRQNGQNGIPTEYRIEVSNGSASEPDYNKWTWTQVEGASGTWDKDREGWNLIRFNAPVEARYVRVVGVHTYADNGSDAHMSMSELRALDDRAALSNQPVKPDPEQPDRPDPVFPDVKEGQWFYKGVMYSAKRGFMAGMPDGSFGPNVKMTRAQLIQTLYAFSGRPDVKDTEQFSDVKPGQWFTKAVSWAVEQGITTGVGNGKFAPNNIITRQEMAVMLHAFKGKAPVDGQLDFTDKAEIADWAAKSVQWAVKNGLMSSTSTERMAFSPKSTATRAEAAVIMMNLDQMG